MPQPNVLVAVIKNDRDFEILQKRRLYRMPARYAPKRRAKYIAFYQPLAAQKRRHFLFRNSDFDGTIKFYGAVQRKRLAPRCRIVSGEPQHPRAQEKYWEVKLRRLEALDTPIANSNRMRMAFGFTTLKKLRQARDIKELFDVPLIEPMLERALKERGILFKREHRVKAGGSRFRLDFAFLCKKGLLAVECDGRKWHATGPHRKRDAEKDQALALAGWRVLRLSEEEIVSDLKGCLGKIQKARARLGGNRFFNGCPPDGSQSLFIA